jgi:hypothetical protein
MTSVIFSFGAYDMFNLLFKKVIVLEQESYISIYDDFSKVTRNTALMSHVNKNMTLKNGLASDFVDITTEHGQLERVIIYAVNRFKFRHLSDASSCAYHQFKSYLTRSSCDWDRYSAYSFRK